MVLRTSPERYWRAWHSTSTRACAPSSRTAQTFTAVDAIGGAANSSLLLQIFADVWGVPVTRLNLVDEATALGAAIVGGVGVGIFDSFDVAGSLSQQVARHDPDEWRHARYLAEYELFLEAYQRLEPWFDKL
jgi:xylulokinase